MLEARFHDATWVGFSARSNEHVIILKDGVPALKARAVELTSAGERWSSDAVAQAVATSAAPNPMDESQRDLRS